MKNTGKRLLTLLIAIALLLGCAAVAQGESGLEPYEIKWYVNGPMPQPELDRILEAVNAELTPINATLKIISCDFGNYVQKMQMVIASGEEFDLCFTSDWSLPFTSTAANGAFLPLEDLLEEYCPTIMATLPEVGWKASTVNGHIYAIPNYQIWCKADELIIDKELADKYGADIETLSKMDSPLSALEPFLAAIKENEPDMIPFGACGGRDIWGDTRIRYGYDGIGDTNMPGVILVTDESCTVINQYKTPEYQETIKLARDWYLKGYFTSDAAIRGDMLTEQKAGLVAATFGGAWKPGGDVVAQQQFGGRPVYDIQYSEAYMTNAMLVATMTAVSRTSKDPARALMFYDMLFSNKKLYNLITLGMEGVDYSMNEDGTASMIENSGYDVSTYGWEFGNQFNQLPMLGQSLTVWEDTMALNDAAIASPLVGFNLDASPIATEIANCNSVTEEFLDILDTGSVDPETEYPKFIQKLEAAGCDRIIEEEQRQIDAWLAARQG